LSTDIYFEQEDEGKWGFIYFGFSGCLGKAFVFLQFEGKNP